MTSILLWVKPWQLDGHKIIQWDISIYYTYLPATFIYNDIGIQQDWPIDLMRFEMFLTRKFEGKEILKMSSGMAYMYAPWFFIAHGITLAAEPEMANGYSLPYQIALAFGAVFWSAVGLYFLFLFLKRFVSPWVASIVLCLLLFGTNLFYYIFWDGAYSHSALFALMAIFLEFGERFVTKQSLKKAIALGFLAGLLILIRPVLLLHVLFLAIFYAIRLKGHFKIAHVLFAGLAAFLIWLPQFFYWHFITGNWIYYSYGEEGFFWSDPKIIEGLFSWRKGWLLYTPIMAIVFPGFYMLYERQKEWFWLILPLFVLHVYVIFSWWCWWYGGSYSQRAMIEIYPLLALPIAFLIQKIVHSRVLFRIVAMAVLVLFVSYNLFTTRQYQQGLIHFDGMTKECYQAIFLQKGWPENYDDLIDPPDYEAAKKGQRDQ